METNPERDALFAEIKKELCAGAIRFLEFLARDHPGETLYSFMFMLSPVDNFALAVAGSIEALDRTAEQYAESGYQVSVGEPIEVLRESLKWLYVEDFWFGQDGDFCDEAGKLFETAIEKEFIKRGDGQAPGLCVAALKEMDAAGNFGSGAARAQIVLGLSYGMADGEDFLKWADELNPPQVVARLKQEIEAGRAANLLLESPWKDQ